MTGGAGPRPHPGLGPLESDRVLGPELVPGYEEERDGVDRHVPEVDHLRPEPVELQHQVVPLAALLPMPGYDLDRGERPEVVGGEALALLPPHVREQEPVDVIDADFPRRDLAARIGRFPLH